MGWGGQPVAGEWAFGPEISSRLGVVVSAIPGLGRMDFASVDIASLEL